MARTNEGPWFRASKGTWYYTVGGQNRSLHVRGEKNKRQAVDAWHRLMAGLEPPAGRPEAPERSTNRPEGKGRADRQGRV